MDDFVQVFEPTLDVGPHLLPAVQDVWDIYIERGKELPRAKYFQYEGKPRLS